MAKTWPDYMGTYKAIVLEWGVNKTRKAGLPQFMIRVTLTDYFDSKEGEWYDVSDNHWTMNAYLCLYGREGGAEGGEIVETLNHTQVCKVFDWDGCGFGSLIEPGKYDGKVIQVRIEENTGEGAKTPVQISWIDVEDTDPNSGLQKLDPAQIKTLEEEFAYLWKNKKPAPAAVSAKKPATKVEVKKVEPPTDTKEDKKKALLEKSKRLRKETVKSEPPPPKDKKKAEPLEDTPIPADYGKRQAWSDIIDLRDKNCTDGQQKAAWEAAVAEFAPNGDEDELDATGWWYVKESVLSDVGQF